MKKIISAVLAVFIMLSLCSCSTGSKAVLVIAGTEINSEIFTYFLDQVTSRPADYGLDVNPEKDDIKQAAIDECKQYLAANTMFKDKNLTLSAAEKVGISDNVNHFWMRFENHYKNIGVSKQTLTKIMTAQAYEDAIFTATYDRGVGDAAAEKKLTDYFYSNYVCFRNVCAYFTSADGATPMTQQEKNDLLAAFDSMVSNAGANVEDFSVTVTNAGYTLSDTVLLKKGSDGYPEGFFEKVAAQKIGTVQTVVYDECVFAVWKEDLADKGESVYASYRSACISDLYADEAQQAMNEYIEALEVKEKNGINSIINKMV